ncbi:MAG: NAD-dependent epimerase/dehydratase family protein [Candidatus Acidiferrum sp.]
MPDKPNGVASPAYAGLLRDFYRGRKVLVAGADGFLGMNCVYALEKLQANISLVSRREVPRAVGFTGTTFHGDLRASSTTRAAVAGQSVVFDFAGTMGAVESNRNPEASLDQDCRAHLSLFQACATASTPPLVLFCSSRLVYGKPRYLPVDEKHPLNPQSIYAAHKITAENYLQVFGKTHHLPYCIFRLSNPYGPYHFGGKKGYGIINHFLRAAAKGESIRIFGDGSQLRDYIHVNDVVTAFLLAAMSSKSWGETFNLGGRNAVSLRSAAERISELAGGTEVIYEPWPSEQHTVETGDYFTDTRRVESILPLPSEVDWDAGLLHALEFYRQECPQMAAESQPRGIEDSRWTWR